MTKVERNPENIQGHQPISFSPTFSLGLSDSRNFFEPLQWFLSVAFPQPKGWVNEKRQAPGSFDAFYCGASPRLTPGDKP